MVCDRQPDARQPDGARANHWAFDHSVFTVSPEYESVFSLDTQRAEINKLELEISG
jgi:hypothetical protein